MHISSRLKQRITNTMLRVMSLNTSDGVYVARRSVLGRKTRIGSGSRINGVTFVRGRGSLTLGNYCAIGHETRFVTSNHSIGTVSLQHELQRRLNLQAKNASKLDIVIGHGVWIGDRAMFMPGVTVGNGAVVGAGAIVTRDVEAYTIVAGNPARKIGDRFGANVAQAIDDSRWWSWTGSQMKQAIRLFDADLQQLTDADALQMIGDAVRAVADETS